MVLQRKASGLSGPGVSDSVQDDIVVDIDDDGANGFKQRASDLSRTRFGAFKQRLAGSTTARSKAVKVSSTVKAVDGCLFYGEDGYWHVKFMLPTITNYSASDTSVQYSYQRQLANLLRLLEGRTGVLTVTGESLNVDAIIEILRSESVLAPDNTVGIQIFENKLESDRERMMAENYKRRVFSLTVRLDDRVLKGSTAGIGKQLYERGQADYGINSPRNHRLISQVDQLFQYVQSAFTTARVATQGEVLGNFVRSMWRGAPERPLVVFPSTKPVMRANQLAWLGEGNVTDLIYELQSDYMGAVGYVSYLALAVLPPELVPTPGLEYLWLNDLNGDPLDIIIHFQVLSPEEIVQNMERRAAIVKDFSDNLRKSNGEAGQSDINETRWAIDDYKDDAKHNNPSVRFTVTAAVTGLTREDLKNTRRAIITTAASSEKAGEEVVWVVPYGKELELHNKCIPGSSVDIDRYIQETELMGLAAGMPHGSDIPRGVGSWLGRLTGRDRGMFMDSIESVLRAKVDAGPVTICVGPSGRGKTTTMIDVGVDQARKGAIVLIREGSKGDTRLLATADIENCPKVTLIDISREPGCFNPGLWGDDRSEQALNLEDFLKMNCAQWDVRYDGSLHMMCAAEIDEHPDSPDFRRVVKALQSRRELRMVGESLSPLADMSEANICWGNRQQSESLMNQLQPGMTVWRSERWRMPLPEKDPKNWTALERFSVACLQLQFGYSRQLSMQRQLRTFTGDDEFHEKSGLVTGTSDLNFLGRSGRSLGSLYWISTQGAGPEDIPPQFRQFATRVIAFRPQNDASAREFAVLLNLNPDDPQVIYDLNHLGCDDAGFPVPSLKGEAMIRLPNGQVVRAQFTRNNVGTSFITHADAYQRVQ